jgi:MFS family permease
MRERSQSTVAIWLVCIGIGLLFMARGAFQPYAFPLFEHLGGLTYTQIALLLNGYVMAQSLCAPLAGWYTDRTSVRFALATSILFGLASFLVIATKPGFGISTVAVFIAGLAFILGKIALNTILVLQSSAEILRRSVAKRATLLNLGSFCGNSIAYQMTAHVGYTPHAVLLGLLHIPLAIGLGAKQPPAPREHKKTWGVDSVKSLCKNRGFLADSLRRFALVLPYGCWGTIIPKYIIDVYHSNEKVWIVYLTSLCTTILGAHFLAVYVSAMLYRRGFKWEWWSMVSVLLYCAGLLLLIFAKNAVMLPIAIIVFICGEVLMTPCFDETAKKHSGEKEMATCMGLLHLVDGAGRLIGSAFALAMYGWMRHSIYDGLYWPVVVIVFFAVCSALHLIAFGIARRGTPPVLQSGDSIALPPDSAAEAIALAETPL